MSQELRRQLRRLTDMLGGGGVTKPVTYIEQLSYLIYLKMVDEEENRRELEARMVATNGNSQRLFPSQAERFRWSKWRFKSGKELVEFVGDEVFPYMSSLVREAPQIAEYFKDAVLEIKDSHVLYEVIQEIDNSPRRRGSSTHRLLVQVNVSGVKGVSRSCSAQTTPHYRFPSKWLPTQPLLNPPRLH